jgi:hypothetical protein
MSLTVQQLQDRVNNRNKMSVQEFANNIGIDLYPVQIEILNSMYETNHKRFNKFEFMNEE